MLKVLNAGDPQDFPVPGEPRAVAGRMCLQPTNGLGFRPIYRLQRGPISPQRHDGFATIQTGKNSHMLRFEQIRPDGTLHECSEILTKRVHGFELGQEAETIIKHPLV